MRAPIVIAASVAGLVAGAATAFAADLPIESSGYDGCCHVEYGPGPLVILDDQPGVVIRRWWLPPWRNRHYYPHGRLSLKKSGTRRHAARGRPRRAPSYARYWTNPPGGAFVSAPRYAFDAPPLIVRDFDPPLPRPRRYPPPAAVGP